MLLVWLLNIPLFAIGPLLIGLLCGIFLPCGIMGQFFSVFANYTKQWCQLSKFRSRRSRTGRSAREIRQDRIEDCKLRCGSICIMLLGPPGAVLMWMVGFPLLTYFCLQLMIMVSLVISLLLITFVSPVLMICIPIYSVRITISMLKGLR